MASAITALARPAASGEGDGRRLEAVHPIELRLRVGERRARFRHANGQIQALAAKHCGDAYR